MSRRKSVLAIRRFAAAPKLHDQRGIALLMLLSIVTMGTLLLFVSNLSPVVREVERQSRTAAALREAREALIGYALRYRDQQMLIDSATTVMYGYLPMPDIGKRGTTTDANCKDGNGYPLEGCQAPPCPEGICVLGQPLPTLVGRLPWRTLGTSPLRDGWSECLWLIVTAPVLSGNAKATGRKALTWDTLGELDLLAVNGAGALASTLASAHARPLAIVYAPGAPLTGQNRGSVANANPAKTDDVSECGGNYDAANYLDPVDAAALGGVSNYLAGTNHASGDTGDAANPKGSLVRGSLWQGSTRLYEGGCAVGDSNAGCVQTGNDVGLPLDGKTLFSALRRHRQFRDDINHMLDNIVNCVRDQIAAGGSAAIDTADFSSPADKTVGRLASQSCYDDTAQPVGYFGNYGSQLFVASPNSGGFSVTTDGDTQSCAGVLVLGNQRDEITPRCPAAAPQNPQSRSNGAEQKDLCNYLESDGQVLTNFTGSGSSFSGAGLLRSLASGQSAQQDIVRCIPAGASLQLRTSTGLSGGQQLVQYDPGSGTLTLGRENVVNSTATSRALYGCAWFDPERSLEGGVRAYFQFSFAVPGPLYGAGVGNTGFIFAAIDAESNPALPCGMAGSHLGYSGDNTSTPRIKEPKIGIEFDQSRDTGFPTTSSGQNSTSAGRNDPCGTSSCGASPVVGYNTHSAIVYWGHEAANAIDAVLRPDNDDNVHGFPTSGSVPGTRQPPRNPSSAPGLRMLDLRTANKVFHARVEITPTRHVDSVTPEYSKTTVLTKVWLLSATNSPQELAAMKNTTRPISQLYPTLDTSNDITLLSDTADIYDVATGTSCTFTTHSGCGGSESCGSDNQCYRPGLRRVRLGFTGSQRTQDQNVTISNIKTTWLQ